MSLPSSSTRPARAGVRPVMVRSSVVLPAPLAPMTAVTDPFATSSDTLSTARTGP